MKYNYENVGVVVTYNRKKLLLKNLASLFTQSKKLDKVIIIDNHSEDGTREEVEKLYGTYNWIIYKYLNENTGGAGGFYYGIKTAFEEKAHFVYLMDDDGRPANNDTYKNIYKIAIEQENNNKLLFLNSLVTVDGKNLSFGLWLTASISGQHELIEKYRKDNLVLDKVNPFNGTLITYELIQKIGFPRKEFFISRDETEYMNRAMAAGSFAATVLDSVYIHPAPKNNQRKILGYRVDLYDNLDKEYYFVRNVTSTYKNNRIKALAFYVLRILTITLYEDNKRQRFANAKTARRDALENRMGRRSDK